MARGGGTVAVVGAEPIGLAALLTAQFYSPAQIIMIDLDNNRLEVAKRFGATSTINSARGDRLWDRNITITTRLVDTVSTPMLLSSLRANRIDAKLLITHRFRFVDILDAYETFFGGGSDSVSSNTVLIRPCCERYL